MQRIRLSVVMLGLTLLLAACQTGISGVGAEPDVTPNAITGDAIEVTALDAAPAEALPTADPSRPPSPAPSTEAALEAAPPAEAVPDAAPPPPKSADQLACEKRKGAWRAVGRTAARTCIMPMRDAGKQCTRESQCQGQCLARSGTCAPMDPLLGCNEVLQANGARVTLCIE